MTVPGLTELDPFDLPEWLGEGEVSWTSDGGLDGHLVPGHLTGPGDQALPCDLLAVDEAYPAPVLDEAVRTHVHQVWRHGQVLLVTLGGRATVTAPGTSWTADHVLEVLARTARAVGADPERWSVHLGLGGSDKR